MASKQGDGEEPEYDVEIWEEVRTLDIPRLDADAQHVAAEVVARLYQDPYIGDEMLDDHRVPLPGCRKVRFDAPDENGRPRKRPRYRLVYRNDPSDGSVAVVAVIAIGERNNLIAYRIAQTRIEKRDEP